MERKYSEQEMERDIKLTYKLILEDKDLIDLRKTKLKVHQNHSEFYLTKDGEIKYNFPENIKKILDSINKMIYYIEKCYKDKLNKKYGKELIK